MLYGMITWRFDTCVCIISIILNFHIYIINMNKEISILYLSLYLIHTEIKIFRPGITQEKEEVSYEKV